ncbi:MAG: hypothetical protein E6J14_05585 [Chloroflexi bacterium]|nr:MAG: hypothetical protein E6J14_05585 [Chloroflexota bacterium]
MSRRLVAAAVGGGAIAAAAAAAVVGCLTLRRRIGSREEEPSLPTHIVLPDRLASGPNGSAVEEGVAAASA